MNWRLASSSNLGAGDHPRPGKFCSRRCGCEKMRFRTKLSTRSGSAALCHFRGANYGAVGAYRRVNSSVEGKWRLYDPLTGPVVKSCSSSGLFIATSGVVGSCQSSTGGEYECEAPQGYNPVLLHYRDTTTQTVAERIGEGEAAEAARSNPIVREDPWSGWVSGYQFLSTMSVSTDIRRDVSASFTEVTLSVEFAGTFRPFGVLRREMVTTSYPATGAPSTSQTEDVTQLVLDGAPLVMRWSAGPNQVRVITMVGYLQPR